MKATQTICGIKLTHDGAVAVVEGGRLVFCHEAEKINNGARYATIPAGSELVYEVFRRERYPSWVVEEWVIDGWKGSLVAQGHDLQVAPYHEHDLIKRPAATKGKRTDPIPISYLSHTHNMGHVLGAYCTAPWAAERAAAHVLVWDGGQNPRLYSVDPSRERGDQIRFESCLHDLYGIIYSVMSYYWGPYKSSAVQAEVARALSSDSEVLPVHFGGYETPGKLMAYIALGTLHEDWVAHLWELYAACGGGWCGTARTGFHQDGALEHRLMAAAKFVFDEQPHPEDPSPEASALLAVHTFLERALIRALTTLTPPGGNLAFTGGSALNIKWNSALRNTGWWSRVWVPPFPNDSGSAVGAACAQMALVHDHWALKWSVFSGPTLTHTDRFALPAGWNHQGAAGVERVAAILERGSVVVFLNGRAELGPRALGARSVLADPRRADMKGRLNQLKHRESYRPVAPICLEEFAPAVFHPGTPDPYMLFDHWVLPRWSGLVPAVVHLDGTARVQTVSAASDPVMHALLTEFHALTGVPLLCNTSANYNGKGFFPSARDAMEWGGAEWVWADGELYHKVSKETAQ